MKLEILNEFERSESNARDLLRENIFAKKIAYESVKRKIYFKIYEKIIIISN